MRFGRSPYATFFFAPDGVGAGGGGGGGGAPPNATFVQSLPETLRGHDAFKEVKDVGDLATRYVGAITPKAFSDHLPEDLRADPSFRDIKDVPGLARSYVNQAKLLGVPKDQLLRMPAFDDAKGMGELFTRLGRPESADKYVIKPPEGKQFTDGDKTFHAAMLPALYEAGLSQKSLDRVMGAFNDYAGKVVGDLNTKRTTAQGEAEAGLKKVWGNAYDQNLDIARGTLRHFAGELKLGDSLVKDIEEAGLASHPALVQLIHHIGTQFIEPGKLTGRNAGGGLTKGAAEAQQEIVTLRADKGFTAAYHDKAHVDHKAAVARMTALYEAGYPGGA